MMKSFLSKRVQRILDLIGLLEVQNGAVDTPVLYRDYDYQPASLTVDINLANSYFDRLLKIEKGDRVEITYKGAATYEDAYAFAMSQDTLCQLLEKVFFHPYYAVVDMARLLFVSPSTIYRWIDFFNEAVEGAFDIHLSTHPLVMRGDEAEVRTFYMSFFKERYPFSDWPFPYIAKEEIDDFLNQVLPMKYGKHFYRYYQCFHLQIAISLQRFCQGFHLTEDLLSQNKRVRTLAQDILDRGRTLHYHSSDPNEGLDQSLRLYAELLAPFVGDRDAETYPKLVQLAEEDPVANQIFIYINKVSSRLCRDFGIHLDNERDLILAIYNALVGTFGRSLSRPIFYSPYLIYEKKIQTRYPRVCLKIRDIIRTYNEVFSLPTDETFVAYIFYVICTTWENFINQLTQNQKPVRILVLSKFSLFHAMALRDQILFYFGNQVEVTVLRETPVMMEEMDLSSYDLLVSNFRLTKASLPTILCESIYTYKDYDHLARAIFNLRLANPT
ncbi:helix-turn-helix domain-containing protein [Kallipyga gabonensis]|uniref:helix-turn-helix domain-containing protein n=1 Tax=Kallipyga gabonensis TaxID=1686287 RepID=UPI0006B60470|nr:helix-turn-helix domain-containing protein [Kallipyga gabonensis]